MAVLEGKVNRYIGLSSDPKPTVGKQLHDKTGDDRTTDDRDLPAGSTFFEQDTGRIYRWSGAAWTLPPADDRLQRELLAAIRELTTAFVALRLGMMEAGTCK